MSLCSALSKVDGGTSNLYLNANLIRWASTDAERAFSKGHREVNFMQHNMSSQLSRWKWLSDPGMVPH